MESPIAKGGGVMIFVLFFMFVGFGIIFAWTSEVIHDHYEEKREKRIIDRINAKYGYHDTDDRK